MFTALIHDLDETITGDIVSPVKREILDNTRYSAYIDELMIKRMPGIVDCENEIEAKDCHDEIWKIVNVADRLDALFFLIVEERMGNKHISERIPSAQARLQSSWYDLPADKAVLEQSWLTVMLPVIEDHRKRGGYGV